MVEDTESRLAHLLRQSIAGDEVAYSEFLRRAAVFIRGVARRKLGARAETDAEDIVQETLLAVHMKRHTWRSDQPVLPWLGAVARYKVIDGFRRRGYRVEVDIDDYAEIIESPQSEAASEKDVRVALDSLAPGQRKVVSGIAVEGRSIREVAAELGITETAVRVALHRGLAAIAAKFGPKET